MEEASKKRPLLSSLDDMLEEEYYNKLLTEKKRRLSHEQVHMFERSFEEENKLDPQRKTEPAKKLGLQRRQAVVWFTPWKKEAAICSTKRSSGTRKYR